MSDEPNGNGRVTIREVYDLLDKVYLRVDKVAGIADAAHKESMAAISALDEKLDRHIIDASVRDQRIMALELWREELPQLCVLRTEKMIAEEHERRHAAHMDSDHERQSEPLLASLGAMSPSEDVEMGDMRRVWRVGRWVIVLAITAMIAWGISFWATSCAEERAEGSTAQPTSDVIMQSNN